MEKGVGGGRRQRAVAAGSGSGKCRGIGSDLGLVGAM